MEKKYPIGGYAPGNYECKCSTCEKSFIGDKRAVQCEPCALEAKARFDALSPEEQEALIKKNASIAHFMFSGPLTPERDLIYRIVKQWGNAVEMPSMEQWLKDYAKQRHEDIEQIEINVNAGLPENEASFQAGYSCGHDTGYERGKREAKPGAVWVKASEFKYELEVVYHAKYDDNNKGAGYFNEEYEGGNHVFIWQDGADTFQNSFHRLLILDESGTAAAGISQDAHEKEIMMQSFDKVRQIFEGRKWVMEGRGSYPYNDDRYKEEVRYMYNEFDKIFKDTWDNIQSKSVDYRKAIIAEYLESPAAAREEDAVEFAEWIRKEAYQNAIGIWNNGFQRCEGGKEFTTAQLYKLFKQQKEK